MIELEQTKSGLVTMKYKGKYIHSKYDPIRESEQFVKGNMELIKKPIIVLYGLGLGYHIESIVSKMNPNSLLYVFEWNKDLIKYCKENNNKIFYYKQVKIIDSKDGFYADLSKYLEKAGDIIIHKPSIETIKISNEVLYNLINDYAFTKQSLESSKDIIKIQNENYENNKEIKYRTIKD